MKKTRILPILLSGILLGCGVFAAYYFVGKDYVDGNRNKKMIETDVEDYLCNYQIETEYVSSMNYLAGKIAPVAADSAMQILHKNDSVDNVISQFESEISYAVNDVNSVADLRLSQRQLDTVSTGIEAICVSDIYKILSNMNFEPNKQTNNDEDMKTLQRYIENKLLTMESYIVTQENELYGQMAALETQVNTLSAADSTQVLKIQNELIKLQNRVTSVEESDPNSVGSLGEDDLSIKQMSDLINQIRQIDDGIASDLEESLKALDEGGDYSDFQRAINTAISKLVEKTLSNDSNIQANKESITELANDIDKNKALQQADINNLKLVVDKVDNDFSEVIKKNREETDLAISQNRKETDAAIADTNKGLNDAKSTIDANKAATDQAITSLDNSVNSRIDANKQASDNSLANTRNEINNTLSTLENELKATDTSIIDSISQINDEITQYETYNNQYVESRLSNVSDEYNTKLNTVDSKIDSVNTDLDNKLKTVNDTLSAQLRDQGTDFGERIEELEENISETGYMVGNYSVNSDGQHVLTLTGGKSN